MFLHFFENEYNSRWIDVHHLNPVIGQPYFIPGNGKVHLPRLGLREINFSNHILLIQNTGISTQTPEGNLDIGVERSHDFHTGRKLLNSKGEPLM